ncbi:hypothetical protein DYB30_002539 [Aphanomyces astaci]|uniref:USP domain-containing protein n=1 Tax=Aphanomyces astaci TaxID=112090 RepID=A0A397AJY3_APHAT|nr:hypothetical protein DYB36_002350 [Aphanomyces astaci]RHY77853.1 hypothetical protein DYB30_002539 [Aphanomyces astaci]
MNAVLQCLFHTTPLQEYFVSQAYVYDVNVTNTHGMQGVFAAVYGDLARAMASPNRSRPIAPLTFKVAIGKLYPQFQGHLQHDAHECLSVLLQGLNEDLSRPLVSPHSPNKANSIQTTKPYVDLPDSNNRPDSEVAYEWWRAHVLRDPSIITALFTGQFKSAVDCSQCGQASNRFEPFSFLQVPLPASSSRWRTIYVHLGHGHRIQKRKIQLQSTAVVADLLAAIDDQNGAQTCSTHASVVVAIVHSHKVHSIVQPKQVLADIAQDLHVYSYDGLAAPLSGLPSPRRYQCVYRRQRLVPFYFLQPFRVQLYGTPLLVPSATPMTGRDLYKWVHTHLPPSPPSPLSTSSPVQEVVDMYCSRCLTSVAHTKRLALWSTPPILVVQLKRFQSISETQSMVKADASIRFPATLSLAPFLAATTTKSTNQPNPPPMPPPCDTVNNAICDKEDGQKPDDPVPTPFVWKDDIAVTFPYPTAATDPPGYDLYGIVCHVGVLGAGHYVAYVHDGVTWWCVDDMTVSVVANLNLSTLMSAAYLLFYQRRDMADVAMDCWFPRSDASNGIHVNVDELRRQMLFKSTDKGTSAGPPAKTLPTKPSASSHPPSKLFPPMTLASSRLASPETPTDPPSPLQWKSYHSTHGGPRFSLLKSTKNVKRAPARIPPLEVSVPSPAAVAVGRTGKSNNHAEADHQAEDENGRTTDAALEDDDTDSTPASDDVTVDDMDRVIDNLKQWRVDHARKVAGQYPIESNGGGNADETKVLAMLAASTSSTDNVEKLQQLRHEVFELHVKDISRQLHRQMDLNNVADDDAFDGAMVDSTGLYIDTT